MKRALVWVGMHAPVARARRRWLALCAGSLLATALASGPAQAQPARAATPDARLDALRELAGVDPTQARTQLASLRDEAVRSGQPGLRLAVDELECRLLLDIDVSQAVRVAEAGLSNGPDLGGAASRLPWLRLRSCHAATLFETGDAAAGGRELDEVLALSGTDDLASAHALALIERGTHRSRKGEMLAGQQDLLKACAMLEAPGLERDRVLCLGALANHHKRIGDLDEAMELLTQLRAQARARAARFEESIHAYGIAEVHFLRADWPLALEAFKEVAAMARAIGDDAGIAYAEGGIAGALGRLGQPAQALPHADTALRLLDEPADPGHAVRIRVIRAKLLAALGRVQESDAELRSVEAKARALKQDWLLAQWLSARSETSALLGRWPEAHRALSGWREVDARLQQQIGSEATTRLRLQFSRERDLAELRSLRVLNEKGEELRRTQWLVLGLFSLLVLASAGFAALKLRQSRVLRSLASTDELTGLPNRRAILAYAEQQMRHAGSRAGNLSVLMIDVDHFKQINDTHGHAVGDAVLRHIGRVLPAALRVHDRLGRIGGEEFLVILPEATLAQAVQVANRIREAIAATPLAGPAGKLGFTVSIGAADRSAESERIEMLLSRADAALYRAKSEGRDAVSVSSAEPGMVSA